MKRSLLLHQQNRLKLAVLLAYLALACASQFLHTDYLADETSPVSVAQHLPSPAATSPVGFVTKSLTPSHHGDCLVCLWTSYCKKDFLGPEALLTLVPRGVAVLPRPVVCIIPTSYGPATVRAPPLV